MQLKHCAYSQGISTSISEETIESALLFTANRESVKSLENLIGQIKVKLYNVMQSPIEYTILACFTLSSTIFCVIWILHGKQITTLPVVAWIIIIGVYFAPLVHLLFGYSFYSIVFSKGTCFFLPSSILTVLSLYLWDRQLKYSKNLSNIETITTVSTSENSEPIITFQNTSMILLIAGFAINWVELSITLLFGATWKQMFSRFEGSTYLVYFLCEMLIFWFHFGFNRTKEDISQKYTLMNRITKTVLNVPFIICTIMLILFRIYEITEEDSEQYLYGGVHQIVILAGFIGAVWLCIYHILYKTSLHVSLLYF